MLALVDCNNFFASCEIAFDPTLRNKPLVVLSNNDGCVIARSKEAKNLNIPMGAPIFKYESLFKAHGVKKRSSNFTLYGDMSNRIMAILSKEEFPIEIYSIDEAFLDLSSLPKEKLLSYAKTLRKKIYNYSGISVSIGIAPTKTLAKASNCFAKKKETEHVHLITNEQITEHLKHFLIKDIWGIGRAHLAFLTARGLKTAYDLCQKQDDWIKKHLTIQGLRTIKELLGVKSIDSIDRFCPRKGLLRSSSFGKEIEDYKELEKAISYFCSEAALRLRKEKLTCSYLQVFLHTNRFKTPNFSKSLSLALPFPTQSTRVLTGYALTLLKKIYKPQTLYKKAGVAFGDIQTSTSTQQDLFVKESPKEEKLMKAFDEINARYGKKTLHLASEGSSNSWKPKRVLKSPSYTTSWNEILHIKI